jgi:hypothetical protein
MAAHSGADEAPGSGTASVVVASFASRRDAERTVASLGHSFRHKARGGGASAFVVTRNPDGSFKLVQSRVLTATGVVAMATFFTAEIMVGLIGIGAARKGAKASRQRAHERQSGVAGKLIDWPRCSISLARMQLACCFTARTNRRRRRLRLEQKSGATGARTMREPSSWRCSTDWAASTTGYAPQLLSPPPR